VDQKITIDSKTNLIEGWRKINNNFVKTGNLYNEYNNYGDFFKIPVDTSKNLALELERTTEDIVSIKYYYYYF
jgi:hypothetical protein